MQKDDEYVGRRVMEMEVSGRRREGPKERWGDTVLEDVREKRLEGEILLDTAAR